MSQSSPQNIPNADIGSSELLNEFPRPSDKALPSGQRGILRLTIWLSALGYAPLLVLGYVMIATVGTMAATLALVDTDGLFSSTFGGDSLPPG
ncbi:hypothetical protein [Bradymonas sediminis]|uniref:Uncharacterized protein n=1 Tax=Bradymonas sediminis TaxID=1548548 RepID=A0A2Z4FPN2_9DELT|nr:hypothetical protein [Bradymonas sediminis]AWV91011.1 hypothetical protein DN745_17425 [Bradymonas sediminis]TDP75247.1 hypothetical protein DFR33_104112 [Bradymonas sediminis]